MSERWVADGRGWGGEEKEREKGGGGGGRDGPVEREERSVRERSKTHDSSFVLPATQDPI